MATESQERCKRIVKDLLDKEAHSSEPVVATGIAIVEAFELLGDRICEKLNVIRQNIATLGDDEHLPPGDDGTFVGEKITSLEGSIESLNRTLQLWKK